MSEKSDKGLVQLIADLDRATAIYQQGINDSENPDAGRAGVQGAIFTIGEHLDRKGLPRQCLIPLIALARAFEDLNNGVTNPLFKPSDIGVKPSLSVEERHKRRQAAIAMDLFMKAGDSKKEAARKVARKLVALGVELHQNQREADPWKVVARWRDEAISGVYGDALARTFKPHVDQILAQGIPPKKAAARLLDGLPTFLNTKI